MEWLISSSGEILKENTRALLAELKLATRSANPLRTRIKQAGFPMEKDFETFDSTATSSLPKLKILELARGQWIEQKENVCLIGSAGTGKTRAAIGVGLAACRQGRRVRFFSAASLVNRLDEAQQQYRLERFLGQLDKTDLLICDELGYLSFSRSGAELLDRLTHHCPIFGMNGESYRFRQWMKEKRPGASQPKAGDK